MTETEKTERLRRNAAPNPTVRQNQADSTATSNAQSLFSFPPCPSLSASSPAILSTLTPSLKALLRQVDGAADRDAAFEAALADPQFDHLARLMLQAIE
jgi:hypothetical protein